MNNLGMLYRYEIKKIIKRRLVWVTFIICMLGIGVAVLAQLLGSYYVDGKLVDTHYHMFQVDQGYEKALSGKTIDQQLLEETVAAYGRIPAEEERYTLTEEYQTYARPYSAIFNLIRFWTGMEYDVVRNWTADESVLYEARRNRLEEEWKVYQLSDTEKAFWQEKETQIKMPLCYFYHEGYFVSARRVFQTVGLLMLLFIAISLPGVFADEHTRRTDQLILAGGQKPISHFLYVVSESSRILHRVLRHSESSFHRRGREKDSRFQNLLSSYLVVICAIEKGFMAGAVKG